MGEWLYASFITTSSQRTIACWLIIVRAMEIIVPHVVALTISAIPLLATIFDLVASIPSTKNVPEDFSALTLVLLIWGE
jgi:hypothetical protein